MDTSPTITPLIIGHRGACGYLPEHTLASYQRAVELGADAVETDVVLTRDGRLVCRHDCELSITTDVAAHAEFNSRKSIRRIEGINIEGWFVQDFTLEEIRTLMTRERFPFRDHSFDGRFPVLSLDDLLSWAAGQRTARGKPLSVIVEIKHATHFESIGLSMVDAVSNAMPRFLLAGAASPAWLESFEIDVLRQLQNRIETPLIQLLDAELMRPANVAAISGKTTFRDMITPRGLAEIATYASGIGVWKRLIVPAASRATPDDAEPQLGQPTSLVADAHAAGLAVHAWTFRNEPRFLAADYAGDSSREYAQFALLGVDGVITDFPDVARRSFGLA